MSSERTDDAAEIDAADWIEMVDRAVDWLLAYPGKGSSHAVFAIAQTPAERAFIARLIASLEQDELRTFVWAVHRAWDVRLGMPRTRHR